MAKSKEKKPKPKAPESAPTVIAIQKTIEERTAALAKRKEAATKDGKLNKLDPKYRLAIKRLKRAQRKLDAEAWRLRPRHAPKAAEAAKPAEGTAGEAPAAPAAAPVAAPAAAPAAPAAEGEKQA